MAKDWRFRVSTTYLSTDVFSPHDRRKKETLLNPVIL